MTTTTTVPGNFRQLGGIELAELDAMRAALLAYNQPLRSRRRLPEPMPAGLLDVIKVAAGDSATTERLAEELGFDADTLREAASFYLQQNLVATREHPLRRLGLTEQATLEDITLHKRWLLKWLHPDRNPNKWQSSMFNSITAAANAASATLAGAPEPRAVAVPIALGAASGKASANAATYRHRPSRVASRKRVRVFLWRDVLRRLTRRAAVVAAVAALAYFGATQLMGRHSPWNLASLDFWPR